MKAENGRPSDGIAEFYDDLSAYYHLLFADWDNTVAQQGKLLDRLLHQLTGPGPKRVLDAACGIGTQAIGLAQHGHRVQGTDLSPAAVMRARKEAARFAVKVPVGVADLRSLSGYVAGPFDVVCALDNALPHLSLAADLQKAIDEVAAVLAPGGLFLASIRDYDASLKDRPRTTPPRVMDDAHGRRITFQVWDWRHDGAGYRVNQYILSHTESGIETLQFSADYWAVKRSDLASRLERAGFVKPTWLEPEQTGFYQPMVAAWMASTS